MKLLVDIPKEFEQHFQTDRFEDSLHRLSADAHLLAGKYEQETAVMLIEAFATAVPVPTHGDLIDRDALLSTENQHYALREDDWYVTTRRVELMPTIIPAEEGGE